MFTYETTDTFCKTQVGNSIPASSSVTVSWPMSQSLPPLAFWPGFPIKAALIRRQISLPSGLSDTCDSNKTCLLSPLVPDHGPISRSTLATATSSAASALSSQLANLTQITSNASVSVSTIIASTIAIRYKANDSVILSLLPPASTSASVSTSSPHSTQTSVPGSDTKSSKVAKIAGTIVGIMIICSLFVGGYLLWRRHRRSKVLLEKSASLYPNTEGKHELHDVHLLEADSNTTSPLHRQDLIRPLNEHPCEVP